MILQCTEYRAQGVRSPNLARNMRKRSFPSSEGLAAPRLTFVAISAVDVRICPFFTAYLAIV